jgi:hypothetical protein
MVTALAIGFLGIRHGYREKQNLRTTGVKDQRRSPVEGESKGETNVWLRGRLNLVWSILLSKRSSLARSLVDVRSKSNNELFGGGSVRRSWEVGDGGNDDIFLAHLMIDEWMGRMVGRP